ncbi:MAG TPA: AraC family transcriptional regulator [Devosia sp.]|nr:AraC family transcriptional regulator [Devosia sp.]
MIETPDLVTKTPRAAAPTDYREALLRDLLSHIRLSGALFLRGHYSAPWGLDSPGNCDLADIVSPGAERLLVFHAVRRGRVHVSAKGRTIEAVAGELAILPHADRHVMGSIDVTEPMQIAMLLPPTPWNEIPVVRVSGGGEEAECVCGYFRCDELLFNAVLRRLPSIITVRPAGTVAILLDAAIEHALADGSRSGGAIAMAHLTELLLSEALRLYAEQSNEASGWLAAASDPVVGRALKLLHDDPGRDWNAEDLARAANTSRSVLGERFKSLLGQSPIHYLGEWRMQLAADLLRSTEFRLAEIAERSGYGSEAAFSRAFHRHVGASPAQWRERGRRPQ